MRTDKEKNFKALVDMYSILRIWDRDAQEKLSDEKTISKIEDILDELWRKNEPD